MTETFHQENQDSERRTFPQSLNVRKANRIPKPYITENKKIKTKHFAKSNNLRQERKKRGILEEKQVSSKPMINMTQIINIFSENFVQRLCLTYMRFFMRKQSLNQEKVFHSQIQTHLINTFLLSLGFAFHQ